jgi:hypothetical protein
LFLPIRIICGNDEPAGDFLPDPNIYSGGQNHRDVSIDLNVPNAAPAAVYQSERFGKDFAHCFSVPAGHLYHVRLHWAEIFDNGAGQRVENIQINERTVLSDLDIFIAAGGMNKALVRDFEHIAPDANGNIVVRVSAAPGSPDQNAKISGIEILEETGS